MKQQGAEIQMMTAPKRINFLFSFCVGIAVFVFAGCSGDGDPGPDPDADTDYYVRFKCNGVQKEYKGQAMVQVFFDDKNLVHRCNIIGSAKVPNTQDAMSLLLVAKEPYKIGVSYVLRTEVEMADNNAIMPQVTAVYLDENKKAYTAQFLPADWYEFNDQAEVTFTEMTDNHFKGTFSARVFTVMPDREELLITDGEFFVSVLK